MSVKLSEFKTYTGTARSGVGANSLDTSAGQYFVSISGNVVSKALAGGEIIGVSLTQKAFASDNQTNAAATVEYMPTDVDNIYDVTITNGTITVADEGKYYDLDATSGEVVDGTTESTTTGQLRMVKFVSATNSKFKIANA